MRKREKQRNSFIGFSRFLGIQEGFNEEHPDIRKRYPGQDCRVTNYEHLYDSHLLA